MHDDLDLRVIDRHHDADPEYRDQLRRRVVAVLEGAESSRGLHTVDVLPGDVPAIDVTTRPPAQFRPRRRGALHVAAVIGAAAAIVALVALAAGDVTSPPPVDSVPAPTTAPTPTTAGATSGGMWPQTTLDEVRDAQRRADAGDPTVSWQVGARLVESDPNNAIELGLVDRFLRQALGWDGYQLLEGGTFSDWEGAADGAVEGSVTGMRFLRCAAGLQNSMYPSEPCGPTIDDLHFQTVSLDIAQLDQQGPHGLWVVTGWRRTADFAQFDPVDVQRQADSFFEVFLLARLEGTGADGMVELMGGGEVPLLYGTTTGSKYERYEVRQDEGPWWPNGGGRYVVRLFADGGATVVEQRITYTGDGPVFMYPTDTTENGRPIAEAR